MNIVEKILRGDNVRISRFHTEAGAYCDADAIKDLLPATWTWFRRKATGRYSIQPWWVYQAIREVEVALHKTDRVLEVGGGYSTLWLSERCQTVCSIEEDLPWAETIDAQARLLHLKNIEVISGDSRSMFGQQMANTNWDVVVIDGPHDRLEIFRHLLTSPSPPRLVIYDDTDKIENRAALHENIPGYEWYVYRGFKPQTIHVCETTVFRRKS